ncbi:cysteine synthase family protein [Bacillus sonorensis]|mgnify:CR=1 FL=1|uniref:O-acetylserine dependent cystathionine beta-synthase MccA n=2 Tax=Bacillus sonorensis TaxID=119858 RepID=M5PDX1_9BACI|nr:MULTISPECIES: cysteine synthase family protein [Bacillus]TWK79057.1 O-acetylserine dependent cystathionine beta-synthase [Bacillus paralicheniformis]ASB88146.1 Cysteine synthase [Bacillus sonorensis]EME75090.1 O-acetylserine dependent cystathionine beta-synthase MccA [Bacillus sonorensis L12]MBG9916015.1 cysteine synthase [Bacillus sonorensis]MCZ0071545.1 cysteine synthase family protein [Bacillus sonorensis]
MNVVTDITQLIGETPLLQLLNIQQPKGVNIYAKLEMMNPGGSIKDRLGEMLIDEALSSGKLTPGGTVIEATAGNTGIGLALAARKHGITPVFCVPEHFSMEKQAIMKALGATIVNTPRSAGMKGAIEKALELKKETPDSYCVLQFKNQVNPLTYYKTLGPEIWNDLDGQVDVFVAGAGSGGTFAGTARFLKERNPAIKTVIVEPEGSILNGGEVHAHKTEGIGMEFIPEYMDQSHFDEIYTVSDDDAFRLVKEAAEKEGLLIGSSSGAALFAALKEAEKAKEGTNIVTVFPDGSDRYLSKKIYEGGI